MVVFLSERDVPRDITHLLECASPVCRTIRVLFVKLLCAHPKRKDCGFPCCKPILWLTGSQIISCASTLPCFLLAVVSLFWLACLLDRSVDMSASAPVAHCCRPMRRPRIRLALCKYISLVGHSLRICFSHPVVLQVPAGVPAVRPEKH